MKSDKRIIIVIMLFVVMTVNFIITLTDDIDYEKRKQSGNERWEQVEERIISIENRVKELEDNARCD